MEQQDEEWVRQIVADQARMEGERAPYESTYRDIDRYIDPFGSGGFLQIGIGHRRVEDLYDTTAVEGLDRCTAAIAGLTIPRNQTYESVAFADNNLMKIPAVKRWCDHATKRKYACRYAPQAGFETQAHEDIRQECKYGTAPLWVDERRGVSLFYKAVHLSEVWVDENYYGRVDRIHRKFELTLRQAVDQFGLEQLSDRSRVDWEDPKKRAERRLFLHMLRPNADLERGKLGSLGKPVESAYIELDQKWIVRRGGYYTMPMAVSRHITGPRDKYGRSPAMKVLATVKGAQAMARTILDAGNRAVNPPILFHDDAQITQLITRPGGLNPGGIDEMGRIMVRPLESTGELPVGLELLEAERGVIDKAFLGEFFRLLSDPGDRMTATQVIETLQKEGVLIAPYIGRRETEKAQPIAERELDILLRAGQIDELPPEVIEAGARPMFVLDNPAARMARAEKVGAFTRWVEIGVQAAAAGATQALDRVNWDNGMQEVGEVLGVSPSSINTDDEIKALREQRAGQEDAATAAEVAPKVAGAALDLARTNQIADQLSQGGGL